MDARRTWAMSSLMTLPALPKMSDPMMNSGTMTNMPMRMPALFEIQPMSGSTSNPGMTHSDATEKPVARARAGIARAKATRMPGQMAAPTAVMRQLNTTAIQTVGDSANPMESSPV